MTPAASDPPIRRRFLAAALAIFLAGALLRIFLPAGFQGFGFDEAIYRRYALVLDTGGLGIYPALCQRYLARQAEPGAMAELPPTRFLYIFTTWAAKRLCFGDAPPATGATPDAQNRDPILVSLKRVTLWFSIGLVGIVGLAGWRILGPPTGLGAMALTAVSPLAIHMGKHALIDGFFAFWATLCLWLLWENLQHPRHRGWLTGFGMALAFMVMAKENAAFVYTALAALVATNRWAKFGTVTAPLLIVGIVGPLAGVLALVSLAGGVEPFIEIYRVFAAKAHTLDYAIATQDGPWYRYLIELLNVSPFVLLLALGAAFTLPGERRACVYLLGFTAVSYLLMCGIRYGLNLRFTTIWALPLGALAAAQILAFAARAGRLAPVAALACFAAACAYDLRQYRIFFIEHKLYEVAPVAMFEAVKIIKEKPTRP